MISNRFKFFLNVLLFALVLFLFPKDTFALSITAYDDNFKVVGSCKNCTELYPDNGVDYVRSIYIIYDDVPLTNGVKYELETTFNLFARGTVGYVTPILFSDSVNQNIAQDYYYVNSSTTVPFPDGGENGKKLNIGYIGHFTSSRSGTSLLEIPFSNRVVFSGIQIVSRSFTYNGDSSVDAIGSASNNIISNNNINTNKIIDNSDKNSNKLKESIDKQTGEQKKTNEILSDSSIDDNININEDSLTDDSGIQDLLLMPLTLMNSVNTGFNSSCSSFSLGSLYGHNLELKCFTISDIIGSNLAGIIDVIISGIFIYLFSKHLRKVFDRTTNLENEEGDVI